MAWLANPEQLQALGNADYRSDTVRPLRSLALLLFAAALGCSPQRSSRIEALAPEPVLLWPGYGSIAVELRGVEPAVASAVQLSLWSLAPVTDHRVTDAPIGVLTLDSLAPGRYILRIALVGYQHPSDTVTVQAGERLHLRAFMEPPRYQLDQAVFDQKDSIMVAGHVVDSAGRPIHHAIVYMAGTGLSTQTDSTGAYALRVPHRTVLIRAIYFCQLYGEEARKPGDSTTINFTLNRTPPEHSKDCERSPYRF